MSASPAMLNLFLNLISSRCSEVRVEPRPGQNPFGNLWEKLHTEWASSSVSFPDTHALATLSDQRRLQAGLAAIHFFARLISTDTGCFLCWHS